MRKSNFTMQVLIIILLIVVPSMARGKKELKKISNKALPAEYKQKISKIYVEPDIYVVDKKFLISSPTKAAGFQGGLIIGAIVLKMANTVGQQLEDNFAKAFPPEEDAALMVKFTQQEFDKVAKAKNLNFANSRDEAEYTLQINILDHGTQWAKGTKLGVYIRTHYMLSNKAGEKVWESVYFMDKKERPIPHGRKGINTKVCIERIMEDYKNDPTLRPKTYEQIIAMLAPKFVAAE